jgi:ribosomal protein S18 acetylase RimI-like enzyme
MEDSLKDRAELAAFLEKVDLSFYPTLSSRIQFDSFAAKAISKGRVLKVADFDTMVAAAVFYANDRVVRTAYLSILVVLDGYRGRGIGRLIVANVINASRAAEMRRITVQTNPDNEAATALYRSFGFRRCEKPAGDYVRAESVFMELLL